MKHKELKNSFVDTLKDVDGGWTMERLKKELILVIECIKLNHPVELLGPLQTWVSRGQVLQDNGKIVEDAEGVEDFKLSTEIRVDTLEWMFFDTFAKLEELQGIINWAKEKPEEERTEHEELIANMSLYVEGAPAAALPPPTRLSRPSWSTPRSSSPKTNNKHRRLLTIETPFAWTVIIQ